MASMARLQVLISHTTIWQTANTNIVRMLLMLGCSSMDILRHRMFVVVIIFMNRIGFIAITTMDWYVVVVVMMVMQKLTHIILELRRYKLWLRRLIDDNDLGQFLFIEFSLFLLKARFFVFLGLFLPPIFPKLHFFFELLK